MALVRAALDGLVPYEPGKPEEEVQRELGLDRVVKLASNEGPWGPFPAALEALERNAGSLNRYPDGGAFYLRRALAERHGVAPENVITAAGADAIVGHVSLATLDPGDEIVTAWPSFISYVLDALKVGAVPRKVPLRDDHYDLDALLEAIRPRTKLVYIATPNNPTGTMTTRAELDDYFARVPEHVLTVLDQAYFEYIEHPDYPDGIAEYAREGRRVLVLRTFSKIYGLAGLRIGYAVGPPDVIGAIGKTRRPFDVNSQAQVAALASLDERDELERRRRLTADGRHPGTDPARARPRAGRARGRQLPLRRDRRRRPAALRGAAAPGRDRPADGRLRRPRRAPDHRRHAGRERVLRRRARVRAGRDELSDLALGILGASRRPPAPANRHMRTTLKRGMGRGAAVNGNGRPVLPPGALSPITIYRQPPPLPRTRWAVLRTALVWLLVALLVCAARSPEARTSGSTRASLRSSRTTPDVKIAAKRLDVALPGEPATALVVGYDRRAGEANGHQVPLRHDHARPRRPEDGVDLDALAARATSTSRSSVPAVRPSARGSTAPTPSAARRARWRPSAS